jgi:hypothetical protein
VKTLLLGDKIARHSKGTSKGKKNERPNRCIVTKTWFEALDSIDQIGEGL